jgi:hypothetical protein
MYQGGVAHTVEAEIPVCQHHWVIEVAQGPNSRGECRLCGAEQQFKNYLRDAPWDDEPPVLPTRAGRS